MRRCLYNLLKRNQTQAFLSWRIRFRGQTLRKVTAERNISSVSLFTTKKVFTSHKVLMSYLLETWKFQCFKTTLKIKKDLTSSKVFSAKSTNLEPTKVKYVPLTVKTPPLNLKPLLPKSWTKLSTTPSMTSSLKPSEKEPVSSAWKKITLKFSSLSPGPWQKLSPNSVLKKKARPLKYSNFCSKLESKQFWTMCSNWSTMWWGTASRLLLNLRMRFSYSWLSNQTMIQKCQR